MNATNHLELKMFGILEEPQTSVCIKLKGDVSFFFFLIRKGTGWCFASSQASQWKSWDLVLSNNVRNIFSKRKKGRCSNYLCHTHICSTFEGLLVARFEMLRFFFEMSRFFFEISTKFRLSNKADTTFHTDYWSTDFSGISSKYQRL